MCVPNLQRYGPFKNGPHLEGAMEVHPFSQTNLKFEPLSLLLTSTKSHFFTHETAEYILSIKISKGFPR